ncbi:hypothetical protein [Aquabacterium sp.]|uniref:DUF7696 family protein n=1 Tax=Aquabacterium sp. TaxID=1872578 RepID=UPI0025B7A92B|nr:hypothetical protein [Aquabacterium sp.]
MTMATTYDGRQVDSSSEAWRAHCEATTLLAWPLHKRRVHLQGVLARRGKDAHRELSELVSMIWKHQQASKLMAMNDNDRRRHLDQLEQATNQRMRADIETIFAAKLGG